jgi:prepilin-type N-terminal cleavage/methylation domain-containing protein
MPNAKCQMPNGNAMPSAKWQMPNGLNKLGKRKLAVSSSSHSAFELRHSAFSSSPHSAFGIRHSAFSIRPAFTLVELMISLAMVLILILGINFVFRSATDAVGAGQNLNGINSDAQSAQPVVFDDLRNVSKNPPCFIIASQLVTQFLNSDDAKTSSDPTVIVTDNNGGATAGGTVKIGNAGPPDLSFATLGPRNHRADLLKFFAHANYHRRSGPDGTYYAADSSDDAYIEIGHAALPTNDLTAYYGPSCLPNTTSGEYNGTPYTGYPRIGAYASDWVLARRVTLLKDPSSIPPAPAAAPNPSSDATDPYYGYGTGTPPPNTAPGATPAQFGVNMAPLSYGTVDNSGNNGQFQSSRYDLAGITPENFDRLVIAPAILGWQNQGYTGTSLWWNPLVYSLQLNQGTGTPLQFSQISTPPYTVSYLSMAPTYSGLASPTASNPTTDPGLWYARAQCNPTVQTPVTAATLAEMAPYFLQHCSQFIVEYAGDYMQQDPATGKMTGLGPDGQIDFYLDAQGNKHIRWYGMPRSSTGVAHPGDSTGAPVLIRGFNPGDSVAGGVDDPTYSGGTPSTTSLNYFTDVIPLRDYYTMFASVPGNVAKPVVITPPWEVDTSFAPSRDYGALLMATAAYQYTYTNLINGTSTAITLPAFNDPANPPRYVAAWHDDMPAMVRILIKVDDPNNKVKDGPWYEYVFRLK